MMMNARLLLISVLAAICACPQVSASVFMPRSMQVRQKYQRGSSSFSKNDQLQGNHDLRWALRQKSSQSKAAKTAMAIPGYGIAEQVFVGGFANFLSIVSTENLSFEYMLGPLQRYPRMM
uniref:Uncharacterized protein n=1 Tax=Entomoneis paludosa TaxID=265537 RepID=A0A7S2YCL9_9STRA|mmetsp:Transcript_27400/g.57375  ORF Transcript_27400/g.57375 Transcript_27400/m.57375 type:complete len:120 (+) Transcript_27400:72-431(+)